MIKMIMKNILSTITTIVLVCILSVTYSCKNNDKEVYHFTKSYIDTNGNPDMMSFISDLKEAGCYEYRKVLVQRYHHVREYHINLFCPTELEIPEKFTKVLKNSKDPIQIEKVKDAIEKAKNVHAQEVASFNKAYQLLTYGLEQLKNKAKDSLKLIDNKDTLMMAFTFDTFPRKSWLQDAYIKTLSDYGKIDAWTFGRDECVLVYIKKGEESNSIKLVYKSSFREDESKVAFCEPDTTLIEKTLLDHLNTLPTRSVDVSYKYTRKVNPANNKKIFQLLIKNGCYNSHAKAVGKHYFIPLSQEKDHNFISELTEKIHNVVMSQHFSNIRWTMFDDKLINYLSNNTFVFELDALYYENGMPPMPIKYLDKSKENIYKYDPDYPIERIAKSRHYYLRGILTPEGLHILRLNTTQSIYVPHDWIHIKKCVDFDYEYYDITKEGA